MNSHGSVVDFQHTAWDAVPVERVADGIERQLIWGERLMVCRVRFAAHVVTALHTHPHEQMTLVQKGRVRFTVNGQTVEASAGDVVCFPSQLEHAAAMLDEEVILLDIFTPVREDFLPRRPDVMRWYASASRTSPDIRFTPAVRRVGSWRQRGCRSRFCRSLPDQRRSASDRPRWTRAPGDRWSSRARHHPGWHPYDADPDAVRRAGGAAG